MSKHTCTINGFIGETVSYALLLKTIGHPLEKVHACERLHALLGHGLGYR